MTLTEEEEELKLRPKDLTDALNNNDKIEDKLHVIMVTSNPCEFKKRWKLASEFIDRMSKTKDVILYIVETIYPGQTFHVTEHGNPYHLQLKTEHPLWIKENMISLGVRYLLPPNWKALAWIDADLKFENPNWSSDTLKILNGHKDIVQLFSHCLYLDNDEKVIQRFTSSGYLQSIKNNTEYYHPGFAWACTREAYKQMGGIFQISILGSGDTHMERALMHSSDSCNGNIISPNYKKYIDELVVKCNNLRMGYTPGVICHFWHGSRINRKYIDRWKIITKYNYDPDKHITFDNVGILIPSKDCPQGLLDDVLQYFQERLEDD
jgi:hypothetical protein